MNKPKRDFFGELEEHLDRAARRRRAGLPPRAAGAALVAVLVAIVTAIALAGGAGPESERDLSAAPGEGCGPPAELLELVPALRAAPPAGDVPRGVRDSIRTQSAADPSGRHARVWGSAEGWTYWVIPQLRCEDASVDADRVCLHPVADAPENRGGGGTTCATAQALREGRNWIHFPSGDSTTMAGFAPPGAEIASVLLDGGGVRELAVRDGIFAGELPGVGLADVRRVDFDAAGSAPTVAVLNATPQPRLAEAVMADLARVNYVRGVVGNAPGTSHRTVVYASPEIPGLAERIATYLSESDPRRPAIETRTYPAPDAVREAAAAADAVVVAGGDLADR